jgi:hypothetical protein
MGSVKYYSDGKLSIGKTKFFKISRNEKPIRKYLRKYHISMVIHNINALFLSQQNAKEI